MRATRPTRFTLGLLGACAVGMSLLPPVPGVGGWSHSPALARPVVDAGSDGADGTVGIDDRLLTAEVRFDRAGDTGIECRWSQFTGVDPMSGQRIEQPVSRVHRGRTEDLYERLCGTRMTHHWIPRRAPERIVEKASDRASDLIPQLVFRTAPPLDRQVVRVGTWFWVPRMLWRPVSVTASIATSAGPLIVTLTATPTHLVWSPGDGGDPVVCAGPGRPWHRGLGDLAASDCMYTYLRPSHERDEGVFAARFSVQWMVTYTSNFGLEGRLPNVRFGVARDVRVVELQALSR